ncbi:Uncharacterized protein DBV15_03629 [Temnothorax longispinosus]|uniref:Uncharacterized protein n=1 Tax=Temnothorax longispinosus TaxID=300112 RepID=A0A4S2KKQ5_9HYME|nr:Uncharacterized protein DBV15_03629 [Temnothorax longispinosus]
MPCVDDTARERDARHSNKWIDSCKLRVSALTFRYRSIDAVEHAARDQEKLQAKNPLLTDNILPTSSLR